MTGQGKILVVEDSDTALGFYKCVFAHEKEGMVLYTSSVIHAFSHIRHNPDISLVFLDLQFPEHPHSGPIHPFAGRRVLDEINRAKQEIVKKPVGLGYLAYLPPYVVGMSGVQFFENGEAPDSQGMALNLGKDFMRMLIGNVPILKDWLRTAPLRSEDLPLTAQKWQKYLELKR